MPELPDVEMMRQKAASALHRKIERVEVKDEGVLYNAPQTLRRHVKNHSFEEMKRIGKNLFVDIKDDQWLRMHFGMTGDLEFSENGNELPKYSRAVFHFDDESNLCYISRRKLGSIGVIEDISTFVDENGLGPDAMSLSKSEFTETLRNKRGMIKTALMDQKTIAGIGNVYVDEILYQCKIHPETKIGDLSDDQLKDIYSKMMRIFKTAINNDADPEKMPKHYLNTHRSEGESCPDCSGEIERIKVGGRSTYFCPDCQKL